MMISQFSYEIALVTKNKTRKANYTMLSFVDPELAAGFSTRGKAGVNLLSIFNPGLDTDPATQVLS